MTLPSGDAANLELSGPSLRLHLVGVGGAGMSALATVLVAMGHQVSGSDAQGSPVLARLERLGVSTHLGHDGANVGQVDGVAYSTAVPAGNPELVEARRRGIPIYTRPQLTGAVCRTRTVLAVSGTHGKTTTTAMLAAVLAQAGWAPGYLVGGELPGGKGGAHWGTSEWLVVEGDESDGSFLHTSAHGALVTNVEADHLDFYGDEASLNSAFRRFLHDASGARVACADDPGAAALATALAAGGTHVTTYGQHPGADARVVNVRLGPTGSTFDVVFKGTDLGPYRLAVPGLHNVLNATGALALALAVEVEVAVQVARSPARAGGEQGGGGMGGDGVAQAARAALAAFTGVARRLEYRGEKDGVTYVDDYAHMPAEVRAVLEAVRPGGWQRVVAVFQPHRYTRTAAHWQEFGAAFELADVVLVTSVYPAGEAAVAGVEGDLVAEAARQAGGRAGPGRPVAYAATRAELVAWLRRELRPGDLCLTMGAGDLTTLPDELLGPSEPVGARS